MIAFFSLKFGVKNVCCVPVSVELFMCLILMLTAEAGDCSD